MPCGVVNDALSEAFCFGHNPQSQEELLAMLDIDRNGSISLEEFIRAAHSSSDIERWLLRLPLTNIVSDAISAAVTLTSTSTEDHSMRQFAAITTDQVAKQCNVMSSPSLTPAAQLHCAMVASLEGLTRCISDGLSSLREVFAIQDRNVHEQKDGLGSKFTVYKLACGNMADFHKGLYARIGSPNLDFEATMKAEHCSKAGCNVPFTTSNYGISTTPQLEWQYIVGNEQLEEVDALDHTGCWYQAFVIKRTDAGALVHFEGTDMSCDETIPLADIPSRIRVRSEKGTIEETCNVVAARHIKLQPVDVKSDGRNNCKWFPGFIISTNEAGVCVHTKNNPGEVIPHSALAERIRARSSVGPLPLDMNDLVSRFSSDFSKFVEEGMVEVKQRHVRILSSEGLQRLVNNASQCH